MDATHCIRCNSKLEGRHFKFCSRTCRLKEYQKTSGIVGFGLPPGTTGTISELRVSCDLLVRGFEVFKALSPHCSCDLAVIYNKKLFRIEVRSGYRNKRTGTVLTNRSDPLKFDIFAIVLRDEIIYEPPLDSLL